MDKLMFNLLNGNYPLFESLQQQLRDSVQKSPLFVIDTEGKVRLAPYTIGIMTNQLYTMEMTIRLMRETHSIDTAVVVGQALKINESMQEQKIAAGITNQLNKIGLTPDAILKIVNNSFTRTPSNDNNSVPKTPESSLVSPIRDLQKKDIETTNKSDSKPEESQGFLDQFLQN